MASCLSCRGRASEEAGDHMPSESHPHVRGFKGVTGVGGVHGRRVPRNASLMYDELSHRPLISSRGEGAAGGVSGGRL